MDKSAIVNYIKEAGRVEMPDVQQRFGLKYSEIANVLSEFEQSGVIRYCDGFTYELSTRNMEEQRPVSVYKPQNEQEAFSIKALWECVKSGSASTYLIQRKLSVGYVMAARALDWMEENEFISSAKGTEPRNVLINREEFISKFGDPDTDDDDSSEEDLDSFLERRRRELMERMRLMNMDDDDDSEDSEDDEDMDIMRSDLRSTLSRCFLSGLQDKNDEEKCILKLSGDTEFSLRFVFHGRALRISDEGNTLPQVELTRRKVENILKKYAPVSLEYNGEICVTVVKPQGLLMALLTLYAAIDAVKKCGVSKHVLESSRRESIGKLCRVLNRVKEQKANEENESTKELTYETLYSDGFDMQTAIDTVVDMNELIIQKGCEVMSKCVKEYLLSETNAYENICMDIIRSIVMKDQNWGLKDAINEAAKEMIAVEYAKQKYITINIHRRVFREFSITSNNEYEELKKVLWDCA